MGLMPRLSLFWRTFLLVASVLLLGVGAAVYLTNTLEGGTRAARQALQLGSLVNLTRNALISSQGTRRAELLQQLRTDEGVQVRVMEPGDKLVAFDPLNRPEQLFAARVKSILGEKTRLASGLNGDNNFWVSFNIDEDEYWLGVDSNRVNGPQTNAFLLVGLTVLIALITAVLTSRLVNRPLQTLADAINRLSKNETFAPLPESGPTELAALNQRFNQLSGDLQQLEADRSLALAGISHDIRTPLARLRLELEMAPLSERERASVSDEIVRIDQIVGQFIDYGRVHSTVNYSAVAIDEMLGDIVLSLQPFVERQELHLTVQCPSPLIWRTGRLELQRSLINLIENARRYAAQQYPQQTTAQARVMIQISATAQELRIAVHDDGPGVPATDLTRLLRPFARLDHERSAAGGSGLGLAIVDRLVRKMDGRLVLRSGLQPAQSANNYRGLSAVITLPQPTTGAS
jgi:two-component system, OmpR family, osmolarity sensor histidine kinase EnvZ